MKREIKFRGKRKDNGEWLQGDLIRMSGSSFIFPDPAPDGFDRYMVDPETAGQYTGLQDKNGKEIYEGDIVKWDDCSNGRYWRFAVVKINPDIQFDCTEIDEVDGCRNSGNTRYNSVFKFGRFIYTDTHNHLIIIGNIRDNPELLK